MAEPNGQDSPERLDRVERVLEALVTTVADLAHNVDEMQQDVRIILRTQVIMTETITNLAEAQKRAEERIGALAEYVANLAGRVAQLADAEKHMSESLAELADVQKQADARMDALILTVDEIIRGRKPDSPTRNPES